MRKSKLRINEHMMPGESLAILRHLVENNYEDVVVDGKQFPPLITAHKWVEAIE